MDKLINAVLESYDNRLAMMGEGLCNADWYEGELVCDSADVTDEWDEMDDEIDLVDINIEL